MYKRQIKDLIALKQFDKQKSADIGKIIFIGTDEKNNHVYVLGRKNHPDIIQNVFHELATCFNINNYLLVDVGQYITPFMRIGGFLSRKFGLIQLGRPIVAKGTMLAYPNLCSMVLQVKKNLQTNSLPKKKQGIPFQNVRIYYCTFSFSMAAIQACIKIGLLPPLAMHHKNNIPSVSYTHLYILCRLFYGGCFYHSQCSGYFKGCRD